VTSFDSAAYQDATRPARKARELAEAEAKRAAEELWAIFSENEKVAVRFGMLPAKHVEDPKYAHIDGRLLAVALFNCASQDGGMAV
jgi:hypothetical protein